MVTSTKECLNSPTRNPQQVPFLNERLVTQNHVPFSQATPSPKTVLKTKQAGRGCRYSKSDFCRKL